MEGSRLLRSDPISSAWGLFQVRYAFLVQELATAVFYLRRRREPKIQFTQIFKKEIRALCPEIRSLKNWRDPRIHARVEFSEHGIALYDWKTRKQLEMNAPDCNSKCDLAVSLALRLAGIVRSLLHDLKADENLVSAIKFLPDPPDRLRTPRSG